MRLLMVSMLLCVSVAAFAGSSPAQALSQLSPDAKIDQIAIAQVNRAYETIQYQLDTIRDQYELDQTYPACGVVSVNSTGGNSPIKETKADGNGVLIVHFNDSASGATSPLLAGYALRFEPVESGGSVTFNCYTDISKGNLSISWQNLSNGDVSPMFFSTIFSCTYNNTKSYTLPGC